MKRLMMLFAIAGWVACGGRAVEAPGSGGAADPGTEDPTPAQPSGAGKSGGTNPLPSHALGDCKPGFSRVANPNRLCNWLTPNGDCFDDEDGACACICPTSGESVCWSSFYGGEGSATRVHCE